MTVLNIVILVLNFIILYIVVSVAKENKGYFKDFAELTEKCRFETRCEVNRFYEMQTEKIEEFYKRIVGEIR